MKRFVSVLVLLIASVFASASAFADVKVVQKAADWAYKVTVDDKYEFNALVLDIHAVNCLEKILSSQAFHTSKAEEIGQPLQKAAAAVSKYGAVTLIFTESKDAFGNSVSFAKINKGKVEEAYLFLGTVTFLEAYEFLYSLVCTN